LTDKELAERIAEGDRDATEALVRKHHAALYRFLYHLTRRREDAEDLAIQTLQRARQAAGRYDGSASMSTWLHRIAFHEFTRWRRRKRWHLGLSHAPAIEERAYGAVLDGQILLEALSTLPDGMRVALLLTEVQGLSTQEAAVAMGIPVGTVKSRIHHAKERLRARLGSELMEVARGNEVFES